MITALTELTWQPTSAAMRFFFHPCLCSTTHVQRCSVVSRAKGEGRGGASTAAGAASAAGAAAAAAAASVSIGSRRTRCGCNGGRRSAVSSGQRTEAQWYGSGDCKAKEKRTASFVQSCKTSFFSRFIRSNAIIDVIITAFLLACQDFKTIFRAGKKAWPRYHPKHRITS